MDKKTESNLRNDFIEAYKTAQRECGFDSPIFIRMLNEHGAYETARRLTSVSEWQKGYEKLAFKGRTDLTVEYIILTNEYIKYFSDTQIRNAKAKLHAAETIKNHNY